MALPVFQLGNFDFLSLDGPPDLQQERVELIARVGVDGIAALKVGRRGQPFVLVSRRDTDDLRAAKQLLDDYKESIGGDAVSLTWADQECGKVLATNVRVLEMSALIGSTGGLSSAGLGWLVAEWIVVAVSET